MKRLMKSEGIEFLMEAHNGLSAKIVEDSGFKGVWASGLTISASLGLRDNNEASWTQILDVIEFMNDRISIPILMDGDTGYGNFNSFRRLVRKLEQKGIAGVCIEDKLFPKTNSFIRGERQPLADIQEFCGKIKAGKDTQTINDFSIVARIEAFIAGWGTEEALGRAHAYHEAGADAILVHSKLRYPTDLFSFMERWDQSCPVVIVPTTYYDVPTEDFERAGVSLIIWANHMLRSSITAMRKIGQKICEEKTVRNVEKTIASVAEVFHLQDAEEYENAEARYLPKGPDVKAIILAATRGEGFGSLTEDRPKCMLQIDGKSILERQVKVLNELKIKDISVVVGYKKEVIDIPSLKYIYNPRFLKGSILDSYLKAKNSLSGPCIISFGDILYETYILRDLLEADGDIVLAVDTSWWQGYKTNREIDAVIGETPPTDGYLQDRNFRIKKIGVEIDHREAHGEWIGIMKLSTHGAELFNSELEQFFNDSKKSFGKTDINMFLTRLIDKGVEVKGYYFRGHWLDIDSAEDLSWPLNGGLPVRKEMTREENPSV